MTKINTYKLDFCWTWRKTKPEERNTEEDDLVGEEGRRTEWSGAGGRSGLLLLFLLLHVFFFCFFFFSVDLFVFMCEYPPELESLRLEFHVEFSSTSVSQKSGTRVFKTQFAIELEF